MSSKYDVAFSVQINADGSQTEFIVDLHTAPFTGLPPEFDPINPKPVDVYALGGPTAVLSADSCQVTLTYGTAPSAGLHNLSFHLLYSM